MGAANSKDGNPPGRKVLVAVDESPVSLDTLRWTASHVLSSNDELHLVTVLDTAHDQQVNIAETAPVPDTSVSKCQAEPGALEYTTRFLEKIRDEVLGAQKVQPRDVKLTPLISCIGNAHDIGRTIAAYAEKQNCDVCVVGSRGLGNFRRAMLGMLGIGSVSEYVVRACPCTVMVHKAEHQARAASPISSTTVSG